MSLSRTQRLHIQLHSPFPPAPITLRFFSAGFKPTSWSSQQELGLPLHSPWVSNGVFTYHGAMKHLVGVTHVSACRRKSSAMEKVKQRTGEAGEAGLVVYATSSSAVLISVSTHCWTSSWYWYRDKNRVLYLLLYNPSQVPEVGH